MSDRPEAYLANTGMITPLVKVASYTTRIGDEAGTKKGIASGTVEGECAFMMYCFNVKFESRSVCRPGDPLFQNNKNTMG